MEFEVFVMEGCNASITNNGRMQWKYYKQWKDAMEVLHAMEDCNGR